MTNKTNELAKVVRAKLREAFGNKCWNKNCKSGVDLQFAHLKETKVKGWGRGRKERIWDVKNHPDCYGLLCKECHTLFDRDDPSVELEKNTVNVY